MDSYTQPLEDHERWFYGGSPPESDSVAADFVATEEAVKVLGAECQCKLAAHTLLARLRAVPSPAALPF